MIVIISGEKPRHPLWHFQAPTTNIKLPASVQVSCSSREVSRKRAKLVSNCLLDFLDPYQPTTVHLKIHATIHSIDQKNMVRNWCYVAHGILIPTDFFDFPSLSYCTKIGITRLQHAKYFSWILKCISVIFLDAVQSISGTVPGTV